MAEQLKTFTFPGRGRRFKYQWEPWTNGKPWKLVVGEDFTVSVKTMQSNARTYAQKHDLKVSTAIVDEGTALVVQFTPKGDVTA